MAASAPSFITGPIIGALADKYGAEWIMFPSFVFAAPWIPLMILKFSLPAFVVFFALCGGWHHGWLSTFRRTEHLVTASSCALGPVGLEVALAARQVVRLLGHVGH